MDAPRHPVPGMYGPAQGRGARVSTAVVGRTRTRTLPLPLPLPRTRTRAVTRARGRTEAVTLTLTRTRTLTCQHSCARQVESHVNQARVVLLVGQVDHLCEQEAAAELPARRASRGTARAAPDPLQSEGDLQPVSASRPPGRTGPATLASFCTKVVTMGSPCFVGRSPALPLAPSLLAPHPMSRGVALAVGAQLLVGRLDRRNNSHRHVRNFRRVTVKRGCKNGQKRPVWFQRDWLTL